MSSRTVKIVAIVAALIVAIAVGMMFKVLAARNSGPRPGVDIPLRGM